MWIVTNPGKLARVLKSWDMERDARLIDLCCGNGESFQVFSKAQYNYLWGIDNSFNLLTSVKTRVPLVQGDARQCPIKDNSFDVVFINKALHHFSNHTALLTEIKRILKPGGYFCFIEPRSTWLRRLFHAVLLSPLIEIFPPFRDLKKALTIESETYFFWLNNARSFFTMREETFRFRIESLNKDLLHYAVKCRNYK